MQMEAALGTLNCISWIGIVLTYKADYQVTQSDYHSSSWKLSCLGEQWYFFGYSYEALQYTQAWHIYSISFLFCFWDRQFLCTILCRLPLSGLRKSALTLYPQGKDNSICICPSWLVYSACLFFYLLGSLLTMITNKHTFQGIVEQTLVLGLWHNSSSHACDWWEQDSVRSWPGTRDPAATATAPHHAMWLGEEGCRTLPAASWGLWP